MSQYIGTNPNDEGHRPDSHKARSSSPDRLRKMFKFWTLSYGLDINEFCQIYWNLIELFYHVDYKAAWAERLRNTTLAWRMQSSNAWNAELLGHSGFC